MYYNFLSISLNKKIGYSVLMYSVLKFKISFMIQVRIGQWFYIIIYILL